MTVNSMSRRNDLDIQADLLGIASRGAKKTRLVYQANLNFQVIRKYLKMLTDKGFIEEKDGVYHTTVRGQMFVTQYEVLKGL